VVRNLPADAVIGVQDVGAFGFLTPNPLVDMVGLVDHEVLEAVHGGAGPRAPDAMARLFDLLRRREVDAVVLFPENFGGWPVLQRVAPGLRPIYARSIEGNLTMAGSELVVALTPWSRISTPSP
jgi:hypothetical protein